MSNYISRFTYEVKGKDSAGTPMSAFVVAKTPQAARKTIRSAFGEMATGSLRVEQTSWHNVEDSLQVSSDYQSSNYTKEGVATIKKLLAGEPVLVR